MKQCTKCKTEKALDEFPKRKSAADGRRNECCACTWEAKQAWNENNKSRIAAYNKVWAAKDPEKTKASQRAARERLDPEKVNAWHRQWYAKNREKCLARNKEWQSQNTAWLKEYVARNEEKAKSRRQKWEENNRGKVRAKARNYQAKKRGAMPLWLTAIQRAQILEMYDVAVACGTQTGVEHHVDHIIPLQGKAVNGLHVPWNLQVIPAFDNLSKNNRIVEVHNGI